MLPLELVFLVCHKYEQLLFSKGIYPLNGLYSIPLIIFPKVYLSIIYLIYVSKFILFCLVLFNNLLWFTYIYSCSYISLIFTAYMNIYFFNFWWLVLYLAFSYLKLNCCVDSYFCLLVLHYSKRSNFGIFTKFAVD